MKARKHARRTRVQPKSDFLLHGVSVGTAVIALLFSVLQYARVERERLVQQNGSDVDRATSVVLSFPSTPGVTEGMLVSSLLRLSGGPTTEQQRKALAVSLLMFMSRDVDPLNPRHLSFYRDVVQFFPGYFDFYYETANIAWASRSNPTLKSGTPPQSSPFDGVAELVLKRFADAMDVLAQKYFLTQGNLTLPPPPADVYSMTLAQRQELDIATKFGELTGAFYYHFEKLSTAEKRYVLFLNPSLEQTYPALRRQIDRSALNK